MIFDESCQFSGVYSHEFHLGDSGSIQGQFMWGLLWTEWHLGRFSPKLFGFTLQVSFHQSHRFIRLSPTTFNKNNVQLLYTTHFNFFLYFLFVFWFLECRLALSCWK